MGNIQRLTDNAIRGALFEAENKYMSLSLVLGATFTMTAAMPHFIFLDADDSTRIVLMPAEADGMFFFISNIGDIGDLTVKEDSNTTTLATVSPGESALFICDGTTWFPVQAISGIDSLTASATELNYLDIATLGTGAASKAVVLDAGEDYTWPATGVLTYGVLKDSAATTITATGAEINYLDIASLGTGAASKAVVLSAGDDYTWPATGIATLGQVRIVGELMTAQGAPTAKTVTAAITAAELKAGIITTTGATGPSQHQLPTGTLLLAEFPGAAAGMAFDFHVINTGTGASDDATLTVNTDVTIVGNPTVGSLTDATIISGSGHFRARYTGGVTWIVYRLS